MHLTLNVGFCWIWEKWKLEENSGMVHSFTQSIIYSVNIFEYLLLAWVCSRLGIQWWATTTELTVLREIDNKQVDEWQMIFATEEGTGIESGWWGRESQGNTSAMLLSGAALKPRLSLASPASSCFCPFIAGFSLTCTRTLVSSSASGSDDHEPQNSLESGTVPFLFTFRWKV